MIWTTRKIYHSIFYFSLMWLLINCAAEASASGGPEDKTGPNLISISPINETGNLASSAKIVLKFDEMIDPVSVPASIQIEPEIEYRVKTRRNTITITPENEWNSKSIIRIQISRKVRDYQNNEIAQAIQLVYSTGGEIPNGSISGRLTSYNPKTTTEVAIFEYPVDDSSSIFRKTEASANGEFVFQNILPGIYTIGAIEAEMNDFGKDFRRFRYGMMSEDSIRLNKNEKITGLNISMADPLTKIHITSIEFTNQHIGTLTFSDGSSETLIIPSELMPHDSWKSLMPIFPYVTENGFKSGDSVTVQITKSNRLEVYAVDPYTFILPGIIDSIPPEVSTHYQDNEHYFIKFNEPVRNISADNLDFTATAIQDSQHYMIDMEYVDLLTFRTKDPISNISILQMNGFDFCDISGNTFEDSLLVVNISENDTISQKIKGGSIIGSLEYDGKYPLIVQAKQIGGDDIFHTLAKDDNFEFSNLPSGEYSLWAYEYLDNCDQSIYFSGIWNPFQRAAKFTELETIVEVRSRWVIEGIRIEFNSIDNL